MYSDPGVCVRAFVGVCVCVCVCVWRGGSRVARHSMTRVRVSGHVPLFFAGIPGLYLPARYESPLSPLSIFLCRQGTSPHSRPSRSSDPLTRIFHCKFDGAAHIPAEHLGGVITSPRCYHLTSMLSLHLRRFCTKKTVLVAASTTYT